MHGFRYFDGLAGRGRWALGKGPREGRGRLPEAINPSSVPSIVGNFVCSSWAVLSPSLTAPFL